MIQNTKNISIKLFKHYFIYYTRMEQTNYKQLYDKLLKSFEEIKAEKY
jgi:hypothetical protein